MSSILRLEKCPKIFEVIIGLIRLCNKGKGLGEKGYVSIYKRTKGYTKELHHHLSARFLCFSLFCHSCTFV